MNAVNTQELIQYYQDQLGDYLEAGVFDYDSELVVVEYEEFRQFILSLDNPTDYQAAYRLGGLTFLEGFYLEVDAVDESLVRSIRRERSWSYGSMRAFELTSEILRRGDYPGVTTKSTTWYCLRANGQVVAVKSMIDGETVADLRL